MDMPQVSLAESDGLTWVPSMWLSPHLAPSMVSFRVSARAGSFSSMVRTMARSVSWENMSVRLPTASFSPSCPLLQK